MIQLRPMTPDDLEAVRRLTVNEEQHAYIRPITQTLAEKNNDRDYHLIIESHRIVGFFVIDKGYSSRYDFTDATELGLLGYFIDHKHQGKGFGGAACRKLREYLPREYPRYASIALTVNCKNLPAQRAYLSGGFHDTGELYQGGRSGPQHIYRMRLT